MTLYNIYNILASGKKSPTKNQIVIITQINLAEAIISFSVSPWKQSNQFHEELHDSKNKAPPQPTTHLIKRLVNK